MVTFTHPSLQKNSLSSSLKTLEICFIIDQQTTPWLRSASFARNKHNEHMFSTQELFWKLKKRSVKRKMKPETCPPALIRQADSHIMCSWLNQTCTNCGNVWCEIKCTLSWREKKMIPESHDRLHRFRALEASFAKPVQHMLAGNRRMKRINCAKNLKVFIRDC